MFSLWKISWILKVKFCLNKTSLTTSHEFWFIVCVYRDGADRVRRWLLHTYNGWRLCELSVYLSIYLPVFHLSIIYLPTYLPIYFYIHPSIHLYLSIYLLFFAYLSESVNQSILQLVSSTHSPAYVQYRSTIFPLCFCHFYF